MPTAPITSIIKAEEQHMLLLFLPIKSGLPVDIGSFNDVMHGKAGANDSRPSTGVHYFMFSVIPAGVPSPIAVPTFTPAPANGGPPKSLLVVLSIYDADFEPYIGSFLSDPTIVKGLNGTLALMDETGIIDDSDPTSAAAILSSGGVAKNASNLFSLLMRYNFADPTIPAVGPAGMTNPPSTPFRYLLGANFPGLTVAKLLDPKNGYPGAAELWPAPGSVPGPQKIYYEPSTPPST